MTRHNKNASGPSINDITHLGGGRISQKVTLLLFSKMIEEGGGRGQKSQKKDDAIY